MFFSTLFFTLFLTSHSKQLLFVFSIFRHGARSEKKDIFNVTWKAGSELTSVGMRQHFLLGYKNRIKYIEKQKFLSETFNPREIQIYATAKNRTIQSALAQMQGLYPPSTGFSLTSLQEINALPPISNTSSYSSELLLLSNFSLPGKMSLVPVFVFYSPENFFNLWKEKQCVGLEGMGKKNKKRKEVKKMMKKLNESYGEEILKIIGKDRGIESGFWFKYKKAWTVLDTIVSEYWEGVNMDKILQVLKLKSIDKLLNDSYKFMELDTLGNGLNNDSDACIYGMSPIFNRIIKYMDIKISKDRSGERNYTNYDLPKYLLYSAHDTSCGAFMGFMRIVFGTEMRYMYFASEINLEICEEKGEYFVKYLINDELIMEFKYEEFRQGVLGAIKTQEEVNAFCGLKDYGVNLRKEHTFFIVSVVVGTACVLFGIVVIFIYMRKKKVKNGLEKLVDN